MISNHIKNDSHHKVAFAVISPIDSSLMIRLLSQAKFLVRRNGYEISIFLFTPIQQYFNKDLIKLNKFVNKWSNLGIKIFHFPVKIEGANIFVQTLLFPLRLFSFIIFCTMFRPHIIHAHSSEAGAIASLLKSFFGYKVVIDILGTVFEEASMKKKAFSNFANSIVSIQEKISIEKSDALVFVSDSLKKYIKDKFHPGVPNVVIPSCVDFYDYRDLDRVRKIIRKKLWLQNKFVVLFSGTFFEWQKLELVIQWLRFIRTLTKNTYLLILTNNDPDTIYSIFEKNGFNKKDFVIKRLDHEDVPNYSSAADLGLLIRDQSIVSSVASPLKYCEYLAAGVPVLSHRGIKLITHDLIINPSIGLMLNSNLVERLSVTDNDRLVEFIQLVQKSRSTFFIKCQQMAKRYYNWDDKIKKIFDLYSEIIDIDNE